MRIVVLLVSLGFFVTAARTQTFEEIKEESVRSIRERQGMAADRLASLLLGTKSLEYYSLDPSDDPPATPHPLENSSERILGWKFIKSTGISDATLVKELCDTLVADVRNCRSYKRSLHKPYHGMRITRGKQIITLVVDDGSGSVAVNDGSAEYVLCANCTSSRIFFLFNNPAKNSGSLAGKDPVLKNRILGKWSFATSGDAPSPYRLYIKTSHILTFNPDGTYKHQAIYSRTPYAKMKVSPVPAAEFFTGRWEIKRGLLVRHQNMLSEYYAYALADECYDIIEISENELVLGSCYDPTKDSSKLQLTRVKE